jgi:hypothetical protein
MNLGRAISATGLANRRRLVVAVSMLAISLLLIAAGHDVIASIHSAWIHLAAPGMQFAGARITGRSAKVWLAAIGACYLVRLNSRFVQSL